MIRVPHGAAAAAAAGHRAAADLRLRAGHGSATTSTSRATSPSRSPSSDPRHRGRRLLVAGWHPRRVPGPRACDRWPRAAVQAVARRRRTRPTPTRCARWGVRLARVSCTAGDLIVASGRSGCGEDDVHPGARRGPGRGGARSSRPTFVLSRVHRVPQRRGPGLVHVDAYRLERRFAELEDLDLAEPRWATRSRSIEWGSGAGRGADASDRIELDIRRGIDPDDDTRWVSVTPLGDRWDRAAARRRTQGGICDPGRWRWTRPRWSRPRWSHDGRDGIAAGSRRRRPRARRAVGAAGAAASSPQAGRTRAGVT
jgi:tRNA A37 threonylcarbamoyladenosine biosynthesis protein TsaE